VILLHAHWIVVANFVPGNFGGNPWKPFTEPRLKNTELQTVAA